MKKWGLAVVIFMLSIYQDIYAQGCSQCRLLSTQGSELDESSFGTNINSGILYLMALPYIMIMLFIFRGRLSRFFKKLLTRVHSGNTHHS